jgi:hypothetical protein
MAIQQGQFVEVRGRTGLPGMLVLGALSLLGWRSGQRKANSLQSFQGSANNT